MSSSEGRVSKAERRRRILTLVAEQAVETQQDLARLLRQSGVETTQATVSRDIRELHLMRVPAGAGRFRYAPPGQAQAALVGERMLQVFREFVVSVDSSENLVVINTLPATAEGVAEAIDGLGAREVIGTMAGERTVFVVVKPKTAVAGFVRNLRRLLSHSDAEGVH